jgi:L-lactate dehydrogenase (cytochrome)
MAEITGSVQKDSIPFFFQLYVNKDRKASEALLKDAEKNGIKGVWFTIDGPVQGKRGTSYPYHIVILVLFRSP